MCACALATAIRGELRGVGCASDGTLNLIGQYSLIIAQSSHVTHDMRREKFHGRIAWTHLVHSAVPSAGSEVGLMPATRRYDVHTPASLLPCSPSRPEGAPQERAQRQLSPLKKLIFCPSEQLFLFPTHIPSSIYFTPSTLATSSKFNISFHPSLNTLPHT